MAMSDGAAPEPGALAAAGSELDSPQHPTVAARAAARMGALRGRRYRESVAAAADSDSLVAVRADLVTKTYGEGLARVSALDAISLNIYRGEFTAIMGASGSGKSTLMHLLAGLDSPTSGRVYFGDTDITHLDDNHLTTLRRTGIGFIFQSFNLLPMLSAEENIRLPLDLAGTQVTPEWFDTIVDSLNIRDRLSHRPAQLSGGQQQRVAIARALINRPQVIFADEPTGNLDTRSGVEVLEFLQRLVREFEQTVIMVTHDPASAVYVDRSVLIHDGRLVADMREPESAQITQALDALRV